ncbi:MAG: twin-arginine translocation signal domain-containing protein [Polyangiaceae bacterium]
MKSLSRGCSPEQAAWSRRHFLGAALGAGAALTLSGPAHASLARAVDFERLVRASHHIVFATPVEASSKWESIGGRERIVTYSRLLVSESLGGSETSESELLVRTLGGRVGDIGQIVHGEAELALNQPSVLFIGRAKDQTLYIQAMSQGEYPTKMRDKEPILALSPRLAEVDADSKSAVRVLNKQRLSAARQLIQEAGR